MTRGMSFDELYPGTYVKAGEFNGKPATLTIKSVKREMLSNGTGGEEGAVIVAFSETEKLFVMNKTNAVCLRAMWGDDSGEWQGHKVTLHPVKDESGLSESGLCIRVKGSPELPSPLKFRARLGRKMVTQTLVPTGNGKGSPSGGPAPAPVTVDEDTGEVFGFDDGPPTDALEPQDDAPTPEEYDDGLEADSGAEGEIPGMDAEAFAASRQDEPTLLHPEKVTTAQLASIQKLIRSTGIYEAELMGVLDSYGATTVKDLTKQTAEYVVQALKERAS